MNNPKSSYKIKYCVASVNVFGAKPEVSFYAYQNNGYGYHRVSDFDSPYIIWYENLEDAKKQIWDGNFNDCILSRGFEE